MFNKYDMTEENSNIFFTSSVTSEKSGIRIDKFIADEVSCLSRSMVQKLILKGEVFCDDETIADKDFKTREGDIYQINIPSPEEATPIAQDIKLDILYEDDDLVVVNKPQGMTVHPAAGATRDTLVNALLFHCKDSLSGIGGVARPGIVHRIDRFTSGILVVAKNDMAHKDLAEQFFKHSIERTYYALVYGVPSDKKGTIEGNIARSSFDRKKMALVQNGGKSAITHYEVVESFKNAVSLVKCNLETGRTHQIRVHLSSIGHHLVGDDVYEKPKKTSILLPIELKKLVNNFPRQALHAFSLGFIHPRSKKFMHFEASIPEDMSELIKQLKQ